MKSNFSSILFGDFSRQKSNIKTIKPKIERGTGSVFGLAKICFYHDVCLFVFVRCFTHFFYVFKIIILLQRGPLKLQYCLR